MFYASGRSSNEAAFLLQCFARVYGTNNINNCSYYCHQASGVGLGMSVGTGTATLTQEDLDLAHELGLVVNVWTVNSDEDLKRMKNMGVDGVITDYPTRAKALWEEMVVAGEQGNLSEHGGLKSQGKVSVTQQKSTE